MYGDYEVTDYEELLEGEGLFEDGEWESGEFEDDLEDVYESYDMEDPDPFIGNFIRSIPTPVRAGLKGFARHAATYAGNAIGGKRGANIGRGVANAVLNNIDWEDGEYEDVVDPFGEFEMIGGDTQVLQEMSHLATLASESYDPEEADQFIGALAGLAGKLIPKVVSGLAGEGEEEAWEPEADEFFPALLPLAAKALPAAMPLISKGIGALGKLFSRKRRTRPMMEALPVIAAKAATDVAKQAKKGKIKPSTVAAVVAKQTAKTLATKPAVTKAAKATKEMAYSGYGPRRRPHNGYPSHRGGYGQQRRRVIRPRYCVY
jgi:hypothetical protein